MRSYFSWKGYPMKYRLLSALAGLLAAPLAFSAPQALVIKSNATGFTLPEYTRFETCEVFSQQVVITQRFGSTEDLSFTKREVRPIRLDKGFQKVLEAAATEELLKNDNFLCDAPSTTVQIRGEPEALVLFSSGGCGSPRLERQGPAARMLRELMDQYCPITHDYGRR
jgi:hypothetical protein